MTNGTQIEGFKASADIAKQTITLATGAIAFTVTFLEKFTKTANGNPVPPPTGLYVSWFLLGLSVIFAMWTLMALNGTLESLDRKANGWTLTAAQERAGSGNTENIKCPAVLMVVAFLAGIVAMIIAGLRLRP